MHISGVHLQDFRNIRLAHLSFDGRDVFFLGGNAQGKTSLLEACGLSTAFRSFRTTDLRHLIRDEGPGEAGVLLKIEHEERGLTAVEFQIHKAIRTVTVDGERVRQLQDFVGRFPTVAIASDDVELLRGSPQARRRFIDLTLAGADHEYYENLRRYTRALKERNSLLKRGRGGPELAAFDQPLAESGSALVAARAAAMPGMKADLQELYGAYAPGSEVPSFAYRPQLDARERESFRDALRANWEKDLAFGTTARGPHRDDFELSVSGRRARHFASEGQQRGLVLALKLASFRLLERALGITPVILADDVLNELDAARRELFWSAIAEDVQVLATGTHPPTGVRPRGWQIWQVNAGSFSIPQDER